MTDYIGVGGAWKTKAAEWIGVGGAWKAIAAEWIGVGGAWKLCYSALAVTASNVTGSSSGAAASGLVTSSTSPSTTPSGGSGNYTYLWAHVSTSSGNTPGVSLSTLANPSWSATVADGTDSVSTWRVTVTDTTYGVSATDDITVTLTWTDIR